MIHLLHGREIDRYFEGPSVADEIRAVFARVRGCASCRRRYERQLLFERARPDAATRGEARLWQAIEASAAAPAEAAASPARAPWATRAGAGLLVAAVAGVALVAGLRPPGHVAEPVARGGAEPGAAAPAAGAPALHLYRNVGGRAEAVTGAVRGGDGLLVAYSNPTDLPYLMVFAVDEKAGVHWYYPAYERLGDDPASASIRTRALGVELGEEIRHALPAGRLQVIALFSRRPHRVLEVELAVAAALDRSQGQGATAALAGLTAPGDVEISLPLEVLP